MFQQLWLINYGLLLCTRFLLLPGWKRKLFAFLEKTFPQVRAIRWFPGAVTRRPLNLNNSPRQSKSIYSDHFLLLLTSRAERVQQGVVKSLNFTSLFLYCVEICISSATFTLDFIRKARSSRLFISARKRNNFLNNENNCLPICIWIIISLLSI